MTKLIFIDWQSVAPKDLELLPKSRNSNLYANNTPVIFSEDSIPLEPWNTFLRKYSPGVSKKTISEYGRDLNKFASFLESHNTSLIGVDESTLIEYRSYRLNTGLSDRSWQREALILRKFFEYLVDTHFIERVPWVQLGRHSVLHPRGYKYGFEVRFLNREQWRFYLHVGLGGETPNGEIDYSRKLLSPQRDQLGATVALNSGMRLQEWSNLLIPELHLFENGYEVDLEAVAKYRKFRTVYLPPSTKVSIENFLTMERKRIIRNAQPSLQKNIDSLAVVLKISESSQRIKYKIGDSVFDSLLRTVPVEHRRIMVNISGAKIEPLALFPDRTGNARSSRSWQRTFSSASKAVLETEEGKRIFGNRHVKSHDFRHTFAIVILQNLQKQGFERFLSSGPTYSISRHTIHNPLLQVQRLLGHASPDTTTQYLRFIDESELTIQKAFEDWEDPVRDYTDYLTQEGYL